MTRSRLTMDFRILQEWRMHKAKDFVLMMLLAASLCLMSGHLVLYSVELGFVSNSFLRSDLNSETSIDSVLKDFQDVVSKIQGVNPRFYKPHSGLPWLGYSEILDFVVYGIYDCGHAVALFNRVAWHRGWDCRPITVFGHGGGHVISACLVGDRYVFVDPLYDFIYRYEDGRDATLEEVVIDWENLTSGASNSEIKNYPIDSVRVRNPKFVINRLIDFLSKRGFKTFELFSLRGLIFSTHLFLAVVFGVLSAISLVFYCHRKR